MNFIRTYSSGLLLTLFVLFCGAWFAIRSPEASAVPERVSVMALSPAVTDAPSEFNVAPGVHSQLASLKARVGANPSDTAHVFMLARTLHDAHQLDEAVRYYAQYLQDRPANREAWLDLAQCYGELERWDEALNAIQGMLMNYPGDPAGRYNEGAIHANRGDFEKARTIWHAIVVANQDSSVTTLASSSLQRLAPPSR